MFRPITDPLAISVAPFAATSEKATAKVKRQPGAANGALVRT